MARSHGPLADGSSPACAAPVGSTMCISHGAGVMPSSVHYFRCGAAVVIRSVSVTARKGALRVGSREEIRSAIPERAVSAAAAAVVS